MFKTEFDQHLQEMPGHKRVVVVDGDEDWEDVIAVEDGGYAILLHINPERVFARKQDDEEDEESSQPSPSLPTESVKQREVKLEMVRFAVSVPLDVARKSSLPDLSCKRKALDLIYEAFKTRAAANIDFYYDDSVKVYSASIVLPVIRQGSY